MSPQECQANEEGTSMTCLSPPLDVASKIADASQPSGKLTNVWFELDGVRTARYRPIMSGRSTITYYLDPTFADFEIRILYMNETKLSLSVSHLVTASSILLMQLRIQSIISSSHLLSDICFTVHYRVKTCSLYSRKTILRSH